MSFNLKTRNSLSDIRGKKMIMGTALEDRQIYIWVACAAIFWFITLQGDVHLIWKIISGLVCFWLWTIWSKLKNGRTTWNLFRIYLRKIRNGETFVNRGADTKYFTK